MITIQEKVQSIRDESEHNREQIIDELKPQIRRLEDSFGFKEKQAGITDLERDLKELEERQPNFKGGPISSEFPVTDVKDIAAERINPLTGDKMSVTSSPIIRACSLTSVTQNLIKLSFSDAKCFLR